MIGPRLSRATGVTPAAEGIGGHVPGGNAIVSDTEDGLLPRCLAAAYAGVEQRAEQADYMVRL